jgi:hypothetical protein
MTDGIKTIPGAGGDPTVDTDEVTRGGQTVHQQIVKIGIGSDGAHDGLVGNATPLPVAGAVTANAGTGVFDVTPAAPVATDYLPVRLSDGSNFYNASGGGGSGGTSQADESAFTEGTTNFTPIGGVLNDTITSDPAEDQAAAARITAKRGLHVNLRNVGGTEMGVAAAPVRIDPTGTTAQPVTDNGGSLTVDGTVAVSGTVTIDSELPAAAALADGAGNPTTPSIGSNTLVYNGTTWDRARGDTANGLDVDVTRLPALPAGPNNIGDVDIASFAAGAITEVQGDVAQGVAVAGNPLTIGCEARTTNPTAVSDGQAVRARSDDLGRQLVVINQVRDLVTDATITLSSTTETTIVAAGGAGVFHDATLLVITNTSATAVRVDIRDATAGTVRLSVGIAANGGAVIPFAVPRPQASANSNWTAQLSAAVTDVRVYLQAVKNV